MSAYTDADVETAARIWWTNSGHDWDEHIEGEDKPHLLSEFRAVLDVVAPAIAARALRDFADRMESADWTHRDDWNMKCAYAFEVRNRADEIEAAS